MTCVRKERYHRCTVITLGVLLLATLATLIAFSTYVYHETQNNCESDCIQINETTKLKKSKHVFKNCSNGYALGDDYFVHVCLYKGEVIVDIRKFIGNRPLRIGIGLKKELWYCLVDKQSQISNIVRDMDYNYTLFAYDSWDIPEQE